MLVLYLATPRQADAPGSHPVHPALKPPLFEYDVVVYGISRAVLRRIAHSAIHQGSAPEFAWKKCGKQFLEKLSSVHPTEIRNFIPPPVIEGLFYCESSALDHAATEAGQHELYSALLSVRRSSELGTARTPTLSQVKDNLSENCRQRRKKTH
uniref:Uncharacterized protein n=1 Tax=Timema bartmani TaxID=61472 RepID=A0A7R9I1Q7_9NEOP|nr:unnamed protein product [Timema bartmani]